MSDPKEYLSSDTTEPRPDWLLGLEAVHVPGVGWLASRMGEETPLGDRPALLLGWGRRIPNKIRARLWREKAGSWTAERLYWSEEFTGLDVVDQDDAARFREALAKETKGR